MATVTIILGLCGSGKTHLANQMTADFGVKKFDENFIVEDHQQRDLTDALRAGIDCVVVEIHYCIEFHRKRFVDWALCEAPGSQIDWIAFENNLEKANANCRRRTNKHPADPEGHVEINRRISTHYTLPSGVKPRPIVVIGSSA